MKQLNKTCYLMQTSLAHTTEKRLIFYIDNENEVVHYYYKICKENDIEQYKFTCRNRSFVFVFKDILKNGSLKIFIKKIEMI